MPPQNLEQERQEIAGESIGWVPLEDRAYLHVGKADATVVVVTGVPDIDMADMTVLLLV